jgi:hypothetical protein
MRRFFWIRLRIFLRQSRWGFALLGLWFTMGIILFHHFEKLRLTEAFVSAVYLRVHAGPLWDPERWNEYLRLAVLGGET